MVKDSTFYQIKGYPGLEGETERTSRRRAIGRRQERVVLQGIAAGVPSRGLPEASREQPSKIEMTGRRSAGYGNRAFDTP